ncbi:MAG: hypothetical protein ACHQ0Y_04935 [Thermodesulfovibrionales bacterium]
MLINFTLLQNYIPDDGSISITVKKNKDGRLGVMYKNTHSLIKKESSYSNDKDAKASIEAIDKASKELDKVLAFAESPEVLTETFEEKISKRFQTAKSLEDAINESTEALNETLKSLKNKKPATTAKPAVKADAKDAKKPEKGKSEPEGGLFGSITSEDVAEKKDTTATTGSASGTEAAGNAEEEEAPGSEELEEEAA